MTHPGISLVSPPVSRVLENILELEGRGEEELL